MRDGQCFRPISAKSARLAESDGRSLLCCTPWIVTNGFPSGIFQSLVIPEKFQHILRILSTNIDGKRKVMFAMTAIKGIGRRFSNIVLKKADVDLNKRAGECTDEEVRTINELPNDNNPSNYLLGKRESPSRILTSCVMFVYTKTDGTNVRLASAFYIPNRNKYLSRYNITNELIYNMYVCM